MLWATFPPLLINQHTRTHICASCKTVRLCKCWGFGSWEWSAEYATLFENFGNSLLTLVSLFLSLFFNPNTRPFNLLSFSFWGSHHTHTHTDTHHSVVLPPPWCCFIPPSRISCYGVAPVMGCVSSSITGPWKISSQHLLGSLWTQQRHSYTNESLRICEKSFEVLQCKHFVRVISF